MNPQRAAIIVVFFLGAAVSAFLSMITLWAIPKIGIASTAGFLVLFGVVVGAVGGVRIALWSNKMGENIERACTSVTVADFQEVIRTLNRYDKDSALRHFEKRLEEEAEKLDKLMANGMVNEESGADDDGPDYDFLVGAMVGHRREDLTEEDETMLRNELSASHGKTVEDFWEDVRALEEKKFR